VSAGKGVFFCAVPPVVSVSRRGRVTSAQTSKRAQNGGYELANKAQGKGKCDDGCGVHGETVV
jgi:hypothetical protein